MENINEQQHSDVSIPRSAVSDLVDDAFSIHLNAEIVALSNDFCKYFYASEGNEDKEYFAIIFENSFIPDVKAINFLANNHLENINKIHAYSIVNISTINEERFVVIVDRYDITSTLASQLQKGKTVNVKEIENIVDKISHLLSELEQQDIYGCNINPSNILMQDGEFLLLKEFINTYPNFDQNDQYLAPELIECHKAARYVKNLDADIYALGVTIYEAYTNSDHWHNHPNMEEYNHARFENSTSKYLLSRVKVPERLRSFLKSTMHDDASVRWKIMKINEWLDGKNSKTHESLSEVKNIIGFKDNNYSTLKSLSYALFNNWQDAMKFIRETKLFKWASRAQLDSDTLDGIQEAIDTKSYSSFVISNSLGSHTKLSKLLSLINCNSSLRQEELAISAVSIPYFIHYLAVNRRKEIIEQVIKIIRNESWSIYDSKIKAVGHLDKITANHFLTAVKGLKIGSPIRGIERFIYTLNPNLSCQSNMLKNRYVCTISELLIALDDHAEKNIKKFTIDKHIIAFIAAKLDLKDEIKASILPQFPKFSEHPIIKGLAILHIAQQHEPNIEIPNICKAISQDLVEILEEYLHNIDFKKKVIDEVKNATKDGNLDNFIEVFSEQQNFVNDYNGYYEACRQVKQIEKKINDLNNQDKIFDGALLLGQKTTVLLSYILCFIVTVMVII